MVVQSFQSLEFAVQNFFPILEENFLDLVDCLGKFSMSSSPQIQQKAINLIVFCGNQIQQQPDMLSNFEYSNGREFHIKDIEFM